MTKTHAKMETKSQRRATVSGSFHLAMPAIMEAVHDLIDAGAQVLSPADPRVVDQFGDFLFVASDRVRAIKLVQSRHLAAIEASDFVWLVAPGGYVGQSAAMEIGYAVAKGIPVFASEVPTDLTLRQYAISLPNARDALRKIESGDRHHLTTSPANVLLDPSGAIDLAHRDLDELSSALASGATVEPAEADSAVERLHETIVRPLRLS
jgi:nucleoside 2-deoxyribosyltransferase